MLRSAIAFPLLGLALLGTACTRTDVRVSPSPNERADAMRESIAITTSDNVRLMSHWYPVAEPKGWALLLHMMPATKESYASLAIALQERGIAVLAIDFRGHGESEGGPNGYERFTDAEQQAKIRDVNAAYSWIAEQRVRATGNPYDTLNPRLVVVGASIGANLALQFLRDNPTIAGVAALSPGLEYRGVATDPIARAIITQQERNVSLPRVPVLLAAGGADDEYSTETVRTLAEILGDRATVRTFSNAGHGTAMFERKPAFLTEVADWIAARVP